MVKPLSIHKNDLHKARIISGNYKGRRGYATSINPYGNVMFYTDEGYNPYCICKEASEISYME